MKKETKRKSSTSRTSSRSRTTSKSKKNRNAIRLAVLFAIIALLLICYVTFGIPLVVVVGFGLGLLIVIVKLFQSISNNKHIINILPNMWYRNYNSIYPILRIY